MQAAAALGERSTVSRIVWWYCVGVLFFWVFDSGIRRLVDWHSAYHASQLLVLVPLAGALFLAVAVTFRGYGVVPRRMQFLAWTWIGSFVYAGTVAWLLGNAQPAFYDFLQFVAPVFLTLWLSVRDESSVSVFDRFASVMLVIGAAVGIYGIYQFLAPPPWDVYWLQHVARDSGMITNGLARPFEIHVFSVLNSPTPCATFLAAAIAVNLYRLKDRRIWPLIGIFVCVIALSLTLVRSAWIALVIAIVVYLLFSWKPWRTASRLVFFGLIVTTFFVCISPWLTTQAGTNSIALRFQTFSHLGTDTSVNARKETTAELLAESVANPTGEGLGIAGSASQLTSFTEKVYSIDGGFQARFAEMGFAGFIGYVATLLLAFVFVLGMWWRAKQSGDHAERDVMAAVLALQAMLIVLDFSLDSHGNLQGALFWIAVGIGLSRRSVAVAADSVKTKLSGYAGSPA